MQPTLALLLASEESGGLSSMFDVGQSSYFWTILIFLLALVPMWKVVFGPIARALDDRENQAREAARAAEAAREEVEQMKASIREDLDRARAEAARQVAEARQRAEALQADLEAKARAEAERERQRAQEEIERALGAARETLRLEAVALAIQVAERVVQREFSPEDQKRLLQAFQDDVSRN